MLAPIPDLLFDEPAHRYCHRGDWFPVSVTRVISDLSPAAARQIAKTKDGPDGWAARGTAIHKALEDHLLGIASGGMTGVIYDNRWSEWVEPLLECWLFDGCEVLACEYSVCDPVKRVAGSFDFLLRTKQGSLVLGDLKTISSAAALRNRKPADAQLGAYAAMLSRWHPKLVVDRCVTVVAAPGETEVKPSDVDTCVAAWLDAWGRYEAEQELQGF